LGVEDNPLEVSIESTGKCQQRREAERKMGEDARNFEEIECRRRALSGVKAMELTMC
jgi:hypothetical protein